MDVIATLLMIAAAPRGEVSLGELERFPPESECLRMMDFANAHRAWLGSQAAFVPPWRHGEWYEWEAEAEYAWRAWDFLLWARRESSSRHARVTWLAELKKMLRPEDWAAGRMPPPAPVWRFTERTRIKK